MSVLKNFFQMAVVLTMVLVGMNLFIVNFGQDLAGQTITLSQSCSTSDVNFSQDSSIKQTDTGQVTSTQSEANFGCLIEEINRMVFGYRQIFTSIFANIDPAEGDTVERFGDILVAIITLIQVVGFVYLPWAMISAVLGGGAP